jgi:hypothetical protein
VLFETDEEHLSDPHDTIASNHPRSDLYLYLKAGQGDTVQMKSGLRAKKRLPAWLAETERKLREFLTLPANWNSYGARTIQPDVVDATIQLLRRVAQPNMPQPIVVPTVRGGVQLEWHMRGIDLEIELASPEKIHVLYEDTAEEAEWDLELSSSQERLADLTARLSRTQ